MSTGDPSPSVGRATWHAFRADVITAVSMLVQAIVVARGLGPADRGVYFLAVLVATLLALFGSFGLTTAAITYAANRRVPLGELHGAGLAGSLVAGAVSTALLLIAAAPLQDGVLQGLDTTMLALTGATVAPLLYAQVAGSALTGRAEVPLVSAIRIGVAVLQPLALIPVVLATGDPAATLAAWAATNVAWAAWSFAATSRRVARPAWPSRGTARELAGFGLRGHVGTLAHHGFLRVDVLFVSGRLGPAAVGWYSQASLIAERISMLGSAVYSGSANRLGSDPQPEAARLTANIVRKLSIVLIPVGAALAALAEPLVVLLFGPDFSPTAAPLRLLLPGTICLTLWYILSLYLVSSLHRPGLATWIHAVALLVALPLYWLAVVEWGMTGAAVVSSLVYGGVFAAGLIALLRTSEVRLLDVMPRPADLRQVVRLASAHRPLRSRTDG